MASPMICFLLVTVYLSLITLTVTQDTPLLHVAIEPEHLFKYEDKVYVRFYQTVYAAAPVTRDKVTEKIIFPSYEFKDIWADNKGRVIVMPGIKKKLKDSYWFGVGDYRNQLKFMYNYKHQAKPAETPLVRSFLVDYDILPSLLSQNHITDEYHKKKQKSKVVNVDQYLPNQFGFDDKQMEIIRRNILPDSLVTYVDDLDHLPPADRTHWGSVLDVRELFKGIGIEDAVPGIYRDASKTQRQTMENDLTEIIKLYDPDNPSLPDIEKQVNKFNKKFKTQYDLPKLNSRDIIAIKQLKQKVTDSLKVDNKPRDVFLKEMSTDLGEIDQMTNELKTLRTSGNKYDYETENKINELTGRIKDKVDEYNQKYLPLSPSRDHLKETDLPKVHAWTEELKAQKQLIDRRNKSGKKTSIYSVPKKSDILVKTIRRIDTDHMFNNKATVNIRGDRMIVLINKQRQYKQELSKVKSFLTTVEAYHKKLQLVIKGNKKAYYAPLKDYSKEAPEKLANLAFDDDLDHLKLKCGFVQDFGTDYQKYMTKINDVVSGKLKDDNRAQFRNKMAEFLDTVSSSSQYHKYNYEVVMQYGNSPEVEKASTYLTNRYKKEEKTVVHLLYHDDGFFETRHGNNRFDVQMMEKTRITVVGHGQNTGTDMTIGTKNAAQIADDISKQVIINGNNEQITLGKISLVACNDGGEVAVQRGTEFGKTVVKKLASDQIDGVVSVRVGKLQISDNGLKLYGQNSELQYRKTPPIFAKESGGSVHYGTVDTSLQEWSSNIIWSDTMPEIDTNTKLIFVSENRGSFPLEYDIKQSKLLTVEDFNGDSSGPLNFQGKQANLNFDSGVSDGDSRVSLFTPDDVLATEKFPVYDKVGVESSVLQLETKDLVNTLSFAVTDSVSSVPDSDNWVPLIDTAIKDKTGNTKVTLINLETTETQIVKIKSDTFTQFKKVGKKFRVNIDSLPKFSKTSIGMSGTGSLMGLGGFIYGAIQLARAERCKENVTCPATKEAKRLTKALEINAYVSMAEGAFGVVTDTVQIAELAVSFKLSKSAVNGIATMSKTTSNFLKVSKVLGNIGTGVGTVGGVVSLGFSAYQLHHAQTKAQKIEFGIQVGLDSLNIAVSTVAIGATITAALTSSAMASSIAAAAGPVGFVVAIVGILASTITSLVFEFKNTRNNARLVGEYFWDLDDIYGKNGYMYYSSNATFQILAHAIVNDVNFETGYITLDSQYIYRTKHGSTGSGKKNYFFWYKDFPKMIENKYQAINIRRGIQRGRGDRHRIYHRHSIKQVILPAIPKSYISYEYSRLPFCTAMHDKGFDIIRRLEEDYRFDYDFYIFPGEQIISSITHEYVDTKLRLRLIDNVVLIGTQALPDKPESLHNKYTFHLLTRSKYHHIILNDGYKLQLERTSSSPCTWRVDYYPDIDPSEISFGSYGEVRLKKSTMKFRTRGDKMVITDKMGGTLLVDPHNKVNRLTTVTQSKSKSSAELKAYLRRSSQWLKGQDYIVVSQFTHRQKYVGKAYYDIKLDTFLYSDFEEARVSRNLTDNVALLQKIGNDAYFMGEENGKTSIWRTDIWSKKIKNTYHLYCGTSGFQITRLNSQENSVLMIQNVHDVSLVYMIYPDNIRLILIEGLEKNIHKLGETCFPTLNDLLTPERLRASHKFPGECIYATTVPVLPLKKTSSSTTRGSNKHYWLYMEETQLPDQTHDSVFCAPSKPPVAKGIIKPNMTSECDDLTLRDIQHLPTGEEVYYFFCEGSKDFFYQVDSMAAVEIFIPGAVDRIEDYGTVKLVKSNNGGLYKFTGTGNFSLAAFSFEYIAYNDNWVEKFKEIAQESLMESFVPILHFQNIDEKAITAWFDVGNERLIIVSPQFDAQDIIYIGPSPSDYFVWLYSPSRQQVMLQRVLNESEIMRMTQKKSCGKAFWKERKLPAGKVVLENVDYAEYMQGGVFAVTNGIMLHVDHLSAIRILGVNNTWMNDNEKNLENELNVLCRKYNSDNIVTLGNVNGISYWHHCGLHKLIAFPTKNTNEITYLGSNKDANWTYFSDGQNVLEVDMNNNKNNSSGIQKRSLENILPTHVINNSVPVLTAELRGKTLLLQPLESHLLASIPMLDNMKSLVIGTSYGSEVIIEAHHWLHYENILITSIGSSGPQIMYVYIRPPYHCSYELEEVETDTRIMDPISNRNIILEDFTRQNGKISVSYLPQGNEAVISVQICDQEPVTLVSNRERYDPIMAQAQIKHENQEANGNIILINTYVVGSVFMLIVLLLLTSLVAVKCKKKQSDQVVTSATHVTLSESDEQSATDV